MMLCFSVFAVLTYYVAATSTKDDSQLADPMKWCEGKPADIFFLVDSSTSIRNKDFKEQLKFVAGVVELFPISANKTRIGVGIFSSHYYHQISFGDFDNSEDLKNNILAIRQRYGNTETGTALKAVRKEIASKARADVTHIVVVLTDGVSQYPAKTAAEAKLLKGRKTEVFAIGIGNGPKIEELKAIGSAPSENYVYNVSSYRVLKDLRTKLAYKACKVPAHQPYCSSKTKTDVIFAFDARAMGGHNVRCANTFIGDVIKNFGNMDDGTVKAGLLAGFCENGDISLHQFSKRDELVSRIRNQNVKGLDQIVNQLHVKSFSAERGGRNDSRHTAVIFVDENTEKFDEVIKQIIKARQMDIEIFVVAIGDNIDLKSLGAVVSQPSEQHLFHVPSYTSLQSFKETFSTALCSLL